MRTRKHGLGSNHVGTTAYGECIGAVATLASTQLFAEVRNVTAKQVLFRSSAREKVLRGAAFQTRTSP